MTPNILTDTRGHKTAQKLETQTVIFESCIDPYSAEFLKIY